MKELIMAYQGEMALKGLNRKTFEVAAMKTIRKRLADLGSFKVYNAQSTIYVEPQDDGIDMDETYRRMQKVFGIAALPARRSVRRSLSGSARWRRSIWPRN